MDTTLMDAVAEAINALHQPILMVLAAGLFLGIFRYVLDLVLQGIAYLLHGRL